MDRCFTDTEAAAPENKHTGQNRELLKRPNNNTAVSLWSVVLSVTSAVQSQMSADSGVGGPLLSVVLKSKALNKTAAWDILNVFICRYNNKSVKSRPGATGSAEQEENG